MDKRSLNHSRRNQLVILLAIALVIQSSRSQETVSADSGAQNPSNSWGISLNIGGEAGGIGASAIKYMSQDVSFEIGVGYSSFPRIEDIEIFPSTNRETTRREATIFSCSRFYFTRHMYASAGLAARTIFASLKAFGQENEVTLGAVGVPVALGFEFGRRESRITGNVEFGFALFAGPAADDFRLSLASGNQIIEEEYEGASGLLIGAGINFYFP